MSPKPSSRLRVAWFSSLPPIRSGIADYCAEILAGLVEHGLDITCYVDECGVPFPQHSESYRVYHFRTFVEHHSARPYDAFVYHIGNNEHTHYMTPYVMRYPGLVVLHDLHVCHNRAHYYMGIRDHEGFQREFHFNHPEEADVWKDVVSAYLRDHFIMTRMPMNRAFVESGHGVLVHSRYAQRELREQSHEINIRHALMPAVPAQLDRTKVDQNAALRELGLSPSNGPFIGVFGHVNGIKREKEIIYAFAEYHDENPDARLVFVGGVSPAVALENDVEYLGLEDAIHFTGFVSREEYELAMVALDFAINLRYPTCGETSRALIELLGNGVPCIVPRYRQFAEFPEDTVEYISLANEHHDLVCAMRRLGSDPEHRRAISTAARQYIEREHSMEACLDTYAAFIRDIAERHKLPLIAREPFLSQLGWPHGVSRRLLDERMAKLDDLLPISHANEAKRRRQHLLDEFLGGTTTLLSMAKTSAS